MATPSQTTKRICAGIAFLIAAAAGSGCAARAEYVYEDEPVYRGRVYAAPPPVVVYREGHPHHHYYPPRREVRVYRAPVHVHRPPPAYHEHRHERRDRDRDDHRRHHH